MQMGMHGLDSALNGLRMSIKGLVTCCVFTQNWCCCSHSVLPSPTERSSPVYSFQPDRKRSPLHSSMLYWLQIDRNQREGDCKRRGGGPINKTSPERQKVSL